ncbi:hypothetical protein CGP82_07440 [Campylobacter sp. LR185c]|nr:MULTISPECIES: hypothetical protein [unclassified Campylobacter]KAA8603415.1 hypothetical protein CGP82_07440 [Campylobacter sp. LR185c]
MNLLDIVELIFIAIIVIIGFGSMVYVINKSK